jgi:hypothetical protein
MQLVCNASPLIFFAKIDLIDVLPKINGNLRIPFGVYQEINGQNDAACDWVEKHKNKYVIKTDTIPKIIESWDLGKGETEVIAHAYAKKDAKEGLAKPFICPSSALSQKQNPRIDRLYCGFVFAPALNTTKSPGFSKPSKSSIG